MERKEIDLRLDFYLSAVTLDTQIVDVGGGIDLNRLAVGSRETNVHKVLVFGSISRPSTIL